MKGAWIVPVMRSQIALVSNAACSNDYTQEAEADDLVIH